VLPILTQAMRQADARAGEACAKEALRAFGAQVSLVDASRVHEALDAAMQLELLEGLFQAIIFRRWKKTRNYRGQSSKTGATTLG